MATPDEVERFLADFKAKMEVYNVVYLNRQKNLQALADFDIRPMERTAYLKNLTMKDYYRGPQADAAGISDLWEFGLMVKNKEAYIKIQLGSLNFSVICVSFHKAEFTITYPYK